MNVTATIATNIEAIRERVSAAAIRSGRSESDITVVAASKGQPADAILEAARAGLRDFGENRVQEAIAKMADLRALDARLFADLRFHLIGHLQTNKAALACGPFAVIHSIDAERQVDALHARTPGTVRCFIEVNIARDPAKHGVFVEDLPALLDQVRRHAFLDVLGLMTVPPLSPDPEDSRPYFSQLRDLAAQHRLSNLSMGMTGDFEVAIEEGATHIRIGRAIFGERTL